MFGFRKKTPSENASSSFDARLEKALNKLDKVTTFNALPALHQLPLVLGPDEEPEFVLLGRLSGREEGVLVATPFRVFFFKPGAFGAFSVHELTYDTIKGVEFVAKPFGGEVSLSGLGLTLTVTKVFPALLCGQLVAYVKQHQRGGV
jgi:hypothetical protein